MKRIKLGWGRLGILAATAMFAAACQDQPETSPLDVPDLISDELAVSFSASNLSASVGERVSIALDVDAPEGALVEALQGYVRWNPSTLRFIGQIPEAGTMVTINESVIDGGSLRMASVSIDGLDRAATFAFEVLANGWDGSLRFDAEGAFDRFENEYQVYFDRDARLNAGLPAADLGRSMSMADWAEFIQPGITSGVEVFNGLQLIPGQFDTYGDADGNSSINVLDALYAANVSVGNFECIIGTAAPARDCVAVNVRPTNSPGLGEPSDTCPPGVEGACNNGFVRTLNVLDVLPIRLEAVGVDQAIVGEAIPRSGTISTGDTVIITGPLTITGSRTFSSDSLYILRGGIMTVGIEAGASGDVTFEAGTRFEGDTTAAIFITRNGQVFANGTPSQPVTFTCEDLGSGRSEGCWGGMFIAGNAILNEGDAGLPPAPAIANRNPGGGGVQKQGEGGAVNFGGNNDGDSSGSIRYAVFQYGGKEVATNNELNNLTLGACGSGTVLENIQVHGGSDDGIEFFGGRCALTGIYATANDDDQVDYSFGFDGNIQFVVAQLDPNGSDKGFEVDNTEDAATYGATPRTGSEVWNVTVIDAGGGKAANYRRGAGSDIRNMYAAGSGILMDYDNDCTQVGTNLTMDFIVYGNASGAAGGGGDCDAQIIAHLSGVNFDQRDPPAGGDLKDPNNLVLPDFRPVGNGISATFSPGTPPAGFLPGAFIGAVPPEGSGGSIPFYAGWTIGWQNATTK